MIRLAFFILFVVCLCPSKPIMATGWRGLYMGGHLGGAVSSSNFSLKASSLLDSDLTLASEVLNAINDVTKGAQFCAYSFIGGGQIGYNWVIGNRSIFSLQTDIAGFMKPCTKIRNVTAPLSDDGMLSQQMSFFGAINYLGTIRSRLGFLLNPALILYGTGGVAYGGTHTKVQISDIITHDYVPPFSDKKSIFQARIGWTVGLGFEWLINGRWSTLLDYNYYNLGKESFNFALKSTILGDGIVPYTINQIHGSTTFSGHLMRLGLNYHY